ncbi:MAG: hypothetical protein R3B99_23430 [Polyangiales bacterium]|nr:hypothetical protein [Myxococcales bacterium]MCB9622185.1 hypothetical protein [Sandaracinus sp.]
MRLESDHGDFVELEPLAHEGAALAFEVRVRRGSFSGFAETSIDRETWRSFARELSVLEAMGEGFARVRSVADGELALVVRALPTEGHFAVEGVLGTREYDAIVSLRFSAFAFDRAQLVDLARVARACAG